MMLVVLWLGGLWKNGMSPKEINNYCDAANNHNVRFIHLVQDDVRALRAMKTPHSWRIDVRDNNTTYEARDDSQLNKHLPEAFQVA